MICISRRISRSSFLLSESTSRPLKYTSPDVGSIKRSRQRPTVDLPQPDSPTKPSVSPARISNDTPSTARTTSSEPSTGKCFTRPRTLTRVSRKLSSVILCWLDPLMIGGNRGGKIVEHATHLNSALQLIEWNFLFSTTRHAMWTPRSKMATRWQVGRLRHDAFDCFQTLFLDDLRAS